MDNGTYEWWQPTQTYSLRDVVSEMGCDCLEVIRDIEKMLLEGREVSLTDLQPILDRIRKEVVLKLAREKAAREDKIDLTEFETFRAMCGGV